jgi:Domain of unknown function (DUF4373)
MNKEQVYFPHYVNARNDRRIKRLRKDLGIEGYGAFVAVKEVLREQIDYRYPISDIDLLAEEFNISEAKLKAVIFNYELFFIDNESNFFSADLIESIQPFLKAKQQRKDAVESRWEKERVKKISENTQVTDNQYMDDTAVYTAVIQSKVNESKVNEIKENTISDFQKNENLDSNILELESKEKDSISLYIEKKEKKSKIAPSTKFLVKPLDKYIAEFKTELSLKTDFDSRFKQICFKWLKYKFNDKKQKYVNTSWVDLFKTYLYKTDMEYFDLQIEYSIANNYSGSCFDNTLDNYKPKVANTTKKLDDFDYGYRT